MKKLLFCLAVILASLGACKKNYTCQCTDKNSGIATNTVNVSANNSTDAESECEKAGSSTDNCFLSN